MAVNPIHGIYLELERAALARGDKAQAAVYRRAIGIHRTARSLKRRGGDRQSVLPDLRPAARERVRRDAS